MPKSTHTHPNAVFFGQMLRQMRLERGMTIKELARECQMHPSFISAMETGANMPSLDTLFALAIVFEADPGQWVSEIARHWYALVRESMNKQAKKTRS